MCGAGPATARPVRCGALGRHTTRQDESLAEWHDAIKEATFAVMRKLVEAPSPGSAPHPFSSGPV